MPYADPAMNRLTMPPSFFASVNSFESQSASHASLAPGDPFTNNQGSQMFANTRVSSLATPTYTPSPRDPGEAMAGLARRMSALQQQQQQQQQQLAAAFPQSTSQSQELDPFDPFRRDNTRSMANLKVAANTSSNQVTPNHQSQFLSQAFPKSTSEARLNALGDSSTRVHGHSRNKSWAQARTSQPPLAIVHPPSVSNGHSRTTSKDSFGTSSESSSVNVAGLVKQFQQSSFTDTQTSTTSNRSAFASAQSVFSQQMQPGGYSGLMSPSLSTAASSQGLYNAIPTQQYPPYPQQSATSAPMKPPRNLQLPPSHTPKAAYPSALPSPMTPLPPPHNFDPFSPPQQQVYGGNGQGGGNAWDAFALTPPQNHQSQPPIQQYMQGPPRSHSLGGANPNDRKADEFLRGLMER
ncbi:hypothetical protein HKX48_006086 [Thoreauomyces humboldtii]|nr:hypothetical protein HKX48_006086 [Thoreauomyces humboldtii]